MTRQKRYLGVRGCILKFRHLCPPLSVNQRFTFILFQEQGQLLSNKKKKIFLMLMELKINICAFFSASTFIFIPGNLFAQILCRQGRF